MQGLDKINYSPGDETLKVFAHFYLRKPIQKTLF